MRTIRPVIVYCVVVALYANTRAEAKTLGELCKAWAAAATRPIAQFLSVDAPTLSNEQLEGFKAWAHWNSYEVPCYSSAPLRDEHAFLLASDIPLTTWAALLLNEKGKLRTGKAIEMYLNEHGESRFKTPALDLFLLRANQREWAGDVLDYLKREFETVQRLDATTRRQMRAEIETRMDTRDIEVLLKARENYRLKVTPNEVITVTGARYPIKTRQFNGEIVIEVPTSKILSDDSNPHYKDADYSSRRVEATLTPEGRVYVPIPDHFARALVFGGNGKVRVTLTPEKDKKFYGLSHLDALSNFEPSWIYDHIVDKSEAERKAILDRVRRDPVGFISELYDARLGPRGF